MKVFNSIIICLLFLSCKKEIKPSICNCGEIIELYSVVLESNSNTLIKFDMLFGYKMKVKNNCSGEIKKFNTDKTFFHEGEQYCI